MKIFNFKNIVLIIVFFFSCSTNYAQQKEKPYSKDLIKVEEKLREGNFPEALGMLDAITTNYPDASDVFYAKALLFGQVGNLDNALLNAEIAYRQDPSLVYANYLIELNKSKKDWPKVIDILSTMREHYPTITGLSRDLLTTMGSTGNLEGALKIYEEEKDKGLHSDTLDVALSDVYFHTTKIKEGIALLEPWRGKSSLSNVYGRLAYGYLEDGKTKTAIAVLEQGIAKTNDASLYLDLADAYKIDGKSKLSFEALRNAFKSDKVDFVHKYRVMLDLLGPNNKTFSLDQVQSLANELTLVDPRIAESYILKGEVLWKRNNASEARSMFLTAVGMAPNQIDAWRMLINIDLVLKQVDDAIVHSKEALAANPGNPMLLYFGGLSYMTKDDIEGARQLLEAALNNSTNENTYLRSMIYGSLGDLYHKIDMVSASDVAYEEAIKLDSTNAMAMNNLAYYLSTRKKDLEKAASYSLRSIELEPNSSTFYDTYAWILFQQGNYGESLKWMEKALKSAAQPSAVLVEHYGDILMQLGRSKEALKQWQKALTIADLSEKDKAKIEEKIKIKKYVE